MNLFKKRCEKAQTLMEKNGIDYIFVGPGTDMKYMFNYSCWPMERLRLFILPMNDKPSFITPSFEVQRLKLNNLNVFFDVIPWEETEDPFDIVKNLVDSNKKIKIAIDDKHWGMFITSYLKILSKATFISAKPVLGKLRIIKDSYEIEILKRIGKALDVVYEEALQLKYSGKKETEIYSELQEIKKDVFRRVGKPIIETQGQNELRPLSGINSSSAHGGGSDRIIMPSDPIYWEMGECNCSGYVGDKTRSFQVFPYTEKYKKIYEIVKKAQNEAFNSVHPGVTCEYVDKVGRKIIEKSGYGEYFTHRIGHGLGLDYHEPPYLVQGNKRTLEPGMVFSIEPGIYLPEKWGIRIEDIVYVTDEGVESFYQSTKDFKFVK